MGSALRENIIQDLKGLHDLSNRNITELLAQNCSNSEEKMQNDELIENEMQRSAIIEQLICNQPGNLDDAVCKLQLAVAYADDNSLPWRLIRSAISDLTRK